MDFVEDDDLMGGAYGGEFGHDDMHVGRRGDRRQRCATGPTDVTFTVFLDPAPQPGEVVYLKGNLPELTQAIPMQVCETGNGRLWKATIRITLQGTAAGSTSAAPGPMSSGLFNVLRGLGPHESGVRGSPPPLFAVNFSVRGEGGQVVRQEDTPTAEYGYLRSHYYYRAGFPGMDPNNEEAFPLFVHDEIHLLQSGAPLPEFLKRFLNLVEAPFAKKRRLLDKALEELIQLWGEHSRPPRHLVFAIAATLGCFRRPHSYSYAPMYDEHDDMPFGGYGGPSSQPLVQGREKESPPSLLVCRWIVRHCPARSDAATDEEEDQQARGEREQEGGNRTGPQLRYQTELMRYTKLGVLHAMETLYLGEKTFDWLKLITFLPEHALPSPINASQLPSTEDRDKLMDSFARAIDQVFDEYQQQSLALRQVDNPGERAKQEQQVTTHMEEQLRGLCTFCPSVEGLKKLIDHVHFDQHYLWDGIIPMVWNRISSLHFGPADKMELRKMITEVTFMYSDDCAIALLKNQHHPSEAFPTSEIIQFVKLVTETRDGVRAAGSQLQGQMRRWLMRHYGRQVDRPKEEKQAASAMSKTEYQNHKEEICEAIKLAIKGWHMVLALPCFQKEEETLRIVLFELSQAYFFKDPDPLLVLDSMLSLEDDIRASKSVQQLENELHRVIIKSVRDIQDTSEQEHAEELYHLLFDKPTPLRFVIIEAFIGLRQAAQGLGSILVNEPIWSRLLSPTWVGAKGLAEYHLGTILNKSKSILQTSAQNLNRGTICLEDLHIIVRNQDVYERLVAQMNEKLDNIKQSSEKLATFDTEFKQLRVYVKMYCASKDIESTMLEEMIERINQDYRTLELQVAASKFQSLHVRAHLPWLYSLRGSDVFAKIWKDATHLAEGSPVTLKQEAIVSSIIPKAKATWEQLAKSIETGSAVLKGIRWCVELDWAKVQKELDLLQETAPNTSVWVPEAVKATKAMRLAAKLRDWAPSMLHLHEMFKELFRPMAKDSTVEELNSVVRQYEHMWEMPLGKMVANVEPYRATINMLTEAMQDYVITAARHDGLLKWLLRKKSTDDFNRLIAICRANTDDSLMLATISSLQQTRTSLAEALYVKPPYNSLKDFLQELASFHVDDTVHHSLISVQQSFDPLIDLLTTHSRTPGVQACYDLKKISESGYFHVVCSPVENEQLVCKVQEGSFNYEQLAELRRQLLMTDVPKELDGATNLPGMLEELVEKFHLLEEYGRCTMELFNLGHFAYQTGQTVITVAPKDPVQSVENHLKGLKQQLSAWEQAIDTARSEHYFLNYFTVREICSLVKVVPTVSEDGPWGAVWPLLRIVDPDADAAAARAHVLQILQDGALSAAQANDEVALLNSFGGMLGRLFEASHPTVRTLEGLSKAQQHAAADLAMGRMEGREQGTPVFVCGTNDASKVTEFILSIYTRRERVPEAEELLLCSPNTTLEEIEILLRRFFLARKHKREDRLYCLGNIHLLPYVVQCGTVEALRKFEGRFGFKDASALVFVSGQQSQMLTNALNRHNIAVEILPTEYLQEAVRKVGEKYHGRQLEAVISQGNGMGKTHHILSQIAQIQRQYDNKPVMHHVEIRETTDISGFVSALLSDPTDPALPTAIHIDLAHILPAHVDTLLFELLIVGMLRDTKNCAVYHRRTVDFFFCEIPNTPQEHTRNQLSFCLLLNRKFLTMSKERMDTETPEIELIDGCPFVTFANNDCLEVTGKTLAATKVEAFNPKSRSFNIGWTLDSAPAIEKTIVYGLLEDVCSSETSPPSFLVFTNFVRFLGQLMRTSEDWNLMNLQLLQNFDPGLKQFKHSLVRILIETARDFALRQVPKQHALADATLLAPYHAAMSNRTSPSGSAQQRSAAFQRSNTARGSTTAPSTAPAPESGGLGRIDALYYVKRFDRMPSWESCVHPVASFKKNQVGTIVGCNIMSLDVSFLGNFVDKKLQDALNLNDLKLEKDWSKVTHADAVSLIHAIEGCELSGTATKKPEEPAPKDYVVTVDNLLKLMSIQARLKYRLPVILMGETGCGKTALVKFLAETLSFKLHTLDIHGGITDDIIIKFLDEAIEKSIDTTGTLIFFDEINAANCMALFKTIIIDRMYGNKLIPENIRIISCCNPYRLRKKTGYDDVALVYQHRGNESMASSDPMKRLVYRVHNLPESLVDVVSDFGALSEKSEEIYINAILRKELPRLEENPGDADAKEDIAEYEMFVWSFQELLCQSQIFVREVNKGERSVVSMRDIVRAGRVFKWFLTYYSKLRGVASPAVSDDRDGAMKINITPQMRPHLRSAVILTLGYCYHSRLDRDERWGYRTRVCDTWAQMKDKNPAVEWLKLDSASDLAEIIQTTQQEFVSQMELGEGIALNEALRENLFMLLVSIMNQIPILLIGKPGCSKSLAMEVLQNNLNGEVSRKEFFKTMPAVEVFAYQCSPLSTPDSILSQFNSARQSNLGHKSTIVCVLLDEVGLAEESPHLPLKVLHRELEDLQGIACVGISNWALDAAKMSRCVTLYRPPPTVEDLCITAEGMVASANLKGYLRALSEAFNEMYTTQQQPDFWGMREFYSTVRVINAELKHRAARGLDAVLEPQVLMKTVQRNFGGQPQKELDTCIEEFFERTGMSVAGVSRYALTDLIQQNLQEPDARHLMLLTKNNAALRLLFECGLLDHGTARVMFGSTFPNDQSDVFVAMHLQRIKSFMQQPISLVLVHCDSFYESLYDLLNQHYTEYAGQRYVRIAHGSKAKLCPIHMLFRVIVITEISDARFRLAPPLLNRFEKQIFLRKDLMTKPDEALLNKLNKFWELLVECSTGASTDLSESASSSVEPPAREATGVSAHTAAQQQQPIAGYHQDLFSSLVLTLRRRHGTNKSQEELFEAAKRLLTWVLTPESVCITAARHGAHQMQLKFGFNLVAEYFERQQHSDLPSFAERLITDRTDWCDDTGAQVMVMTYSPIRGKIGEELTRAMPGTRTAEVSLHELSSGQDIERLVNDFYASAPTQTQFLLIHADLVAASLRMIEHCRFVCEKARSAYMSRNGSQAEGAASMFVLLVVHLQRGVGSNFSFDYDSHWHFVFLDSVEQSVDLNSMPALGSMLNMPLIKVVQGLEFPKLLKDCFRSSLSRLIYPHTRRPEDLQLQIRQILEYLEDGEFTVMVRDWVLEVLCDTPKNPSKEAGSVGEDTSWFAAVANAAHELALAGTFRSALYNQIVILVSSLLTVLLAHVDRNGSLALLSEPKKRQLWLSLSTASLTSALSARMHNEARSAIVETPTAQHEVGTDAQTGARPFVSRFPVSWFVSRSIDGVRHTIESLEPAKQLSALEDQYKMSKLHEVKLDPSLGPALLDDYINDFTAMHLDWTMRIDRDVQQLILKKRIQRNLKGGKLGSILEVHQLFWNLEKPISYCINLLNAVPSAVDSAKKLIDEADLDTLNLDLLLLVQQTLTTELHGCKGIENKKYYKFYWEWLKCKMVVSGLTKEFLESCSPLSSGGTKQEKLARLKTDTAPRIETLALLLQHVASPLNLNNDIVQQFLTELPAGKIRHSKTLLAILQLAHRIAAKPAEEGQSVEDRLQACSAFIESWILDVCLSNAEAISDLDESCLRLICSFAAGSPLTIELQKPHGVIAGNLADWSGTQESVIANLPDSRGVIPRSNCLNLALLRKLLIISQGEAKKVAVKSIESLLKNIVEHEKLHDTTFATRFAVLCEETAASDLEAVAEKPAEWPTMTLHGIFQRGTEPAKMLQDVGKVRWMLTQYANVLSKEDINLILHDECERKVSELLHTDDEQYAPVCRSMRLYLLKCIERARGISFLRGLLAEQPLCETTWVAKWRDLHDIDFEKFIGAALVPKWNPFSGEDCAPEYKNAKEAIYDMMTSTATDKLDKYAKTISRHTEFQRKRDIGGLLLALCQEPGLLAALEDMEHRPGWRGVLNKWLITTTDLPVSPKERTLLRLFAGDETVFADVPEPCKNALQPFIVSGGRKMDELLRWRLLGHLASVIIAAPTTSLLSALHTIMLEPEKLMDQPARPAYFPGMDEDIRNRVMKALLDRGENIWKFKSHWYKCTCGYTFFIGECGRPMEVATCPGCNQAIGGKDHNKTKSTKEDDETDRSPFGYMLPTADKDGKHTSFREIPSSSARAIRLFLHSAMFCGIAAAKTTSAARIYDHVINPDSMCTMRQENEAKYIGDHFNNDFQQMVDILSSNVEDLACALHSLLRNMSSEIRDEPKSLSNTVAQAPSSAAASSVGAAAADVGSGHSWLKLTLQDRNNWEDVIEAKYLTNTVKNFDSMLQDLYKKWGGTAEEGKFVTELKEAADIRHFPKQKREVEMPQLWAYRSPVTLDALHARLGVQKNAPETLPVLCSVLQQPLFPVLPALRLLTGVFEWHTLVINQYSGRITRSDAGSLKVRDVLNHLAPSDRTVWEGAFERFAKAWHTAWPYVERFGCLELGENLKQVMIDKDSAMLWCIADSEGEGICPLALTQWLVERHNELVQVVHLATKFPGKKVSSRLLGQHDVIMYDEEELMNFVRSRCVNYVGGGKLNFDFKQLEQQLRREMSKPEITMELRGFQWLGQAFSGSNELQAVIKQRDLSPEVLVRLREELASPSVANMALQKVQMSISFILKSGGGLSKEHGGEMLLSDYLRKILADSFDAIPSNIVRSEVRLWHLDAFAKLLRQIINKNPIDGVDPKYKADLPKDLEQALAAAKSKLPPALVDVLGNFAEAHLTTQNIGTEYAMMEIITTLRDDNTLTGTDYEAIQANLPAGLKMKHWAKVYGVLTQK